MNLQKMGKQLKRMKMKSIKSDYPKHFWSEKQVRAIYESSL